MLNSDWKTAGLMSITTRLIRPRSQERNEDGSITPESGQSWSKPEPEETQNSQKLFQFPIWTIIRTLVKHNKEYAFNWEFRFLIPVLFPIDFSDQYRDCSKLHSKQLRNQQPVHCLEQQQHKVM